MKPVVPKPDRVDGYRLRAGCLPFSSDGKKILLISSSRDSTTFIIPAGTLEENEFKDPVRGALRETKEEAGVTGSIMDYLGVYTDTLKKKKTHYYAMIVERFLEEFDESAFRKRRWFEISEALQILKKRPLMRTVLDDFVERRK